MVHFHIISKLVKVSSEALLKYHLYEFELASVPKTVLEVTWLRNQLSQLAQWVFR